MAITVADNFSYQGKKPLDGRDTFTTLAAMKAYAEASVYDGCLSYCDEDGKRYEFKSTNTVDPTTGKWREYSSGGGGETYSDFTGATASTAGAHGLVPAPSAGDEGKVLFGNGLWGALPSVDLSMLSNEAFIFSETEKPVGMWTDRKLLYAKTVDCGAGPINTTKVVSAGISNLDKTVYINGIIMTANPSDPWYKPIPEAGTDDFMYIDYNNGNIRLRTSGNYSNGNCYATLFYTKTTDSPLPSDVKFAGVTSSGEVILEKHISLTNKPLPYNIDVDCGTLSGFSKVSVVADVNNSGIHFNNGRWFGAYVDNGGTIYVSQIFSSQTPTCDIELTIRYTTTS